MLIVCPLNSAQGLVDTHGASHVVSLLGPDTAHRTFTGIALDNHLRLTFHDIIAPAEGFVSPQVTDAERLVAFLERWNRCAPLVIHCWAGISRSTASAFTALCMYRPRDDEEELAWKLRAASPSATPNRLIVSHVDSLLGRRGRMLRAVEAIGRGEDCYEGTPFVMQLDD